MSQVQKLQVPVAWTRDILSEYVPYIYLYLYLYLYLYIYIFVYIYIYGPPQTYLQTCLYTCMLPHVSTQYTCTHTPHIRVRKLRLNEPRCPLQTHPYTVPIEPIEISIQDCPGVCPRESWILAPIEISIGSIGFNRDPRFPGTNPWAILDLGSRPRLKFQSVSIVLLGTSCLVCVRCLQG